MHTHASSQIVSNANRRHSQCLQLCNYVENVRNQRSTHSRNSLRPFSLKEPLRRANFIFLALMAAIACPNKIDSKRTLEIHFRYFHITNGSHTVEMWTDDSINKEHATHSILLLKTILAFFYIAEWENVPGNRIRRYSEPLQPAFENRLQPRPTCMERMTNMFIEYLLSDWIIMKRPAA